MVAHNGERWLERSLGALAETDRVPDRIVAVDTGSRDDTAHLLANALGGHAVVSARKSTGFGAAVKAGLAHVDANAPVQQAWPERIEWVWLLHDDCAPAPDALRRLLECAVRRPEAAVIGPKVRSWGEDRQLLEVGLSITRGGRRHTGLEKREYDQGQHDFERDVLAVGSAGMLIRRDVWEALGGFDPHLSVFRDDVDFGWRANLAGHAVVVCPAAVVGHAEAAAHGRRKLGVTRQRVHMVDRRNALYIVLANAPAWRWMLVLVRMVVAGFGRALAFLVGKQPALALEEIGAVLATMGRPDRIIRARRARQRIRKVPDEKIRALFPPAGQQLRHAGESVLAVVTGAETGHDLPSSRRRAAAETGPSEDDDAPLDESVLVTFFTKPAVLLVGGLILLTLAASRRMFGGGRLLGGGLFPAPDTPAAVWATYTEAWHGIGLGSDTAAPPYVAVVGVLSTVFRSPTMVVDLMLLGSVPLAGLTAYLLMRRLVESRLLRVWGAAFYALLPATTGAIAAGRLGTAFATVLTPLLALAVMRTLGVRTGQAGHLGPFRAAWSAGLVLAIITAFTPIAWAAALILAVLALGTIYRTAAAALRMVVILAVSPVVLAPWTFEVLRTPSLVFTEAGVPGPGLSDPNLAPWAVLLQYTGGPGAAPIWFGVSLLLAGWAALLRIEGRRPIVAAWAVALTGLGLGLLVSRRPVTGPTLETPVAGWPGYPVVLVAAGLIVAAVLATAGIRTRLSNASFGWRQPLAVALVIVAGVTPVVLAGWWAVRGADDPLERRNPALLPAYAAEEGERENAIRTLVLNRPDDGRVTYALLRESGPRLGDAEVGPSPEMQEALDDVVTDLVSGRGGADASALVDFAVKYVYLPPTADPGLTEVFDTLPGLTRASAPEGGAMWQVAGEIARVRVIGGDDPIVVPSHQSDAGGMIPPSSEEDRLLVLAERADPGWQATLSGEALPRTTYNGWAQAFELPDNGGEVELTYDGTERSRWMLVQLAAVIVAIILALPGMRRQKGAVDDAADVGTDEVPVQVPRRAAEPVPASASAPQPAPGPQPAPAPALPPPPITEPVGEPLPLPPAQPGRRRRTGAKPEQPVARRSGKGGKRAKGRRRGNTGGER
jgi:GT2 family glycosyltransferase